MEHGLVTLRLVDAAGAPVAVAFVTIAAASAAFPERAFVPDETGRVSIALPVGTAVLEVRFAGLEPRRIEVEARVGGELEVTLIR
ncbi:MAG: carboxypeptidase-like regulatory domain-containing protein [Beijerinckiaceae bacterium]|nr:carboxypeptidase-like regulatory domain-containing protein [Beijerinckiaceae bacterium]